MSGAEPGLSRRGPPPRPLLRGWKGGGHRGTWGSPCFLSPPMSAIVALTTQNTAEVTAVQEVPPEFVTAQLEAVFSDIGVDAAKTGMLFSAPLIEAVADRLSENAVPLV